MPAMFVGHGSPMNAIEYNEFSRAWDERGRRIREHARPRAIVAVSAHWFTEGLRVSDAPENRHIDDMYGFPPQLYEVRYAPSGDPALARRVAELVNSSPASAAGEAGFDRSWGIDHGVWAPLVHLVPEGDIPVVMVSVDARRSLRQLFDVGRALAPLRREGVLVVGSGNVVHNLRLLDPSREHDGSPWAVDFDRFVADAVREGRFGDVVDGAPKHAAYARAVPWADHFGPLAVVLGAVSADEPVEVWSQAYQMGSLSMTSFSFGEGASA